MVNAQKDLLSYLSITAPFDGVVTDRLVHPGALVGTGEDPPCSSFNRFGTYVWSSPYRKKTSPPSKTARK